MARNRITKKKKILNKTSGRCAYCGCTLNVDTMTVDHIIPKIEGGSNHIDNLNPSCHTCNLMKNRLSIIDFMTGARRIARKMEKDILTAARRRESAIRSTRECILYYKRLTGAESGRSNNHAC